MRELRLLDSIREHNVIELPVVFRGTPNECEGYATRLGYRWRRDNSLFGGYFSNPDNGNCLFVT